ncbi:hypothetical protein MUN89_13980 [Halobacillus salinarum]|uniref:Magnesium transporter MgtE intracellular domain-containing protein n=1 Tax=Halobacillus salinarum TaxID=2932257 RepID=A0ABY4EHT9_9BACI|nr:hypothetical protein [Halobacillus salinarum]UOQ43052.1 hypothetical protein MUN89_13980 [Halobacillus salinarum]
MGKLANQEEEKGSKLQSFFFIFVVPLIFAITVVLIILTVKGVHVIDYAQKISNDIPGVSKVVSTSEEKDKAREQEQVQSTIQEKDEKIASLKDDVDMKQATIEDLHQQIEKLEADLAASKEVNEEQTDKLKELAQSFEGMDEEKAAPILESMDGPLAVQVLEKVPSEERGKILGEMSPEKAAALASSILGSN